MNMFWRLCNSDKSCKVWLRNGNVWWHQTVTSTPSHIYYRCSDGRFPLSASCGQFQTPIRFPALKQGLILEQEAGESNHFFDWVLNQKAIGGITGIYSTEKRRAETLQSAWKFDDFKYRLKSCMFECTSLLNWSFFFFFFWEGERGDARVFSWKRKICNSTITASYNFWTVLVFTSIVFGILCSKLPRKHTG
jgi:hypothetical protein